MAPDLLDPEEDLQAWFLRQRKETPDEMYYKEASSSQILFVRDKLAAVLSVGLSIEEYKKFVTVISTHKSKSVKLPVYKFSRPDLGLTLFARNNFYNWKLSVISEKPLELDLDGLCHTTPPIEPDYSGNPLSPVYFEGFPEELVFGYYSQNKSKFSAEIYDDLHMWTVLFLIMRATGTMKPYQWSTQAGDEKKYATK